MCFYFSIIYSFYRMEKHIALSKATRNNKR